MKGALKDVLRVIVIWGRGMYSCHQREQQKDVNVNKLGFRQQAQDLCLPEVPHKAVAEFSIIDNSSEFFVMHGRQGESTDGPRGGWSCGLSSGCSGHPTHNS